MKNYVVLEFPKSISSLAGYEYGKNIYDNQIKNILDINNDFTIAFPEQIKSVAYSFVQGLFCEIVDQIGLKATEERLVIDSKNEKLKKIIKIKLFL